MASSSSSNEIDAMFDMLQMPQYAKRLHALGYHSVASLLPALDELTPPPSSWLQIFSNSRDRTIVLGYLSIRRRKDPEEVRRNEQRMQSFRAVKETLAELSELQLRKAELERGSTVLQRKEAVRQEIENLLDRIDEAKEKLQQAQSEISTQQREQVVSLRRDRGGVMSAGKTRKSDSGTRNRCDSPRLAGESKANFASSSPKKQRHPAAEPELRSPPSNTQPSSAPRKRDPFSAFSTTSKPSSDSDQKGGAGCSSEAAGPRRPATVTTPPMSEARAAYSFGVCPDFSLAASGNSQRNAPPRNNVQPSAPHSFVGPGWNRNPIVPKSKFMASRTAWGAASPRPGSAGGGGREVTMATPTNRTDMFVTGVRATPVSLGVALEDDHYAQMCCGAAVRGL